MEKYILNRGSGTLHRESCAFARDIFHLEKAFLVEELLKRYPKRYVCCRKCLKNDGKAQKFVEMHNISI